MRVYYRGPDAVVTSEFFIRRRPLPGTYAVRDLRNVCIAPDDKDSAGVVLIATCASPVAAAVLVQGLAGPWVAAGFLLLAGAVAAVALLRRQRRPRRLELRADYRGSVVALYESADARVFNQVSRALLRALENAAPPSAWDEPVAA